LQLKNLPGCFVSLITASLTVYDKHIWPVSIHRNCFFAGIVKNMLTFSSGL